MTYNDLKYSLVDGIKSCHNSGVDIRVITSNIRFENPEDGPHDWRFRKNLLAERLLAFHPQLIGTQEGRQAQIRELQTLLTGQALLESHRQWIHERMYPCFFYDPLILRPIRQQDFWLSATPYIGGSKLLKSQFPRLVLWCEFEHRPSKNIFIAGVCHLDHELESTRLDQAKILLQQLAIFNPSKLPVLLMGDFNSPPQSLTHNHLLTDGPNWIDPWHEKRQPERPSTHHFGKEKLESARIDWILIPQIWRCQSIEMDQTQQQGIYPSDHYPILASLSTL